MAAETQIDIDSWLAATAGRAELCLARYDGAHRRDATSVPVADAVPGPLEIAFGEATWRCVVDARPAPDRADTLAFTVKFTVIAGEAHQCAAGVQLGFDGWSLENVLLIPGAVVHGNRFACRPQSYPPRLTDPADLGPDTPVVITDVPRLQQDEGPSRIQLLTGDCATPAMGFYDPHKRHVIWLLTTQGTAAGDSGLTVEESKDRQQAVFSVTAPGVREETKYAMCTTQAPSDDRGADLAEGDSISVRLRLCLFAGDSVQDLYDTFALIRKDLAPPATPAHILPFSEMGRLLEEKQNRDNWREEPGFYAKRGEVNDLFGVGWGAGGVVAESPLLAEGSEISRDRARKTLDFLFARCQTPAGFFFDHHDGQQPRLDERSTVSDKAAGHLVRRDAEALYALLKLFAGMRKADPESPVPEAWSAGTRRCADAWVRHWKHHGQVGQLINVHTGEIVVGRGTNGGLFPAALARAAAEFEEARYLECAEEMALSFYEDYVKPGLIHGGTQDALQSPDSESAFALLDSFVTLYETTGARHWIAKAEATAAQCTSWCMSYDFAFPPACQFGRLGMRTTGTVYPNTQNKHAAPGICTLSPGALLRLFRATGEQRYLELLWDIAHAMPQFLSRGDRPIMAGGRAMPPGMMNERVNTSDWEGREYIGEVFYGSCWCEVAALLTWAEVPGLYVQPDTGFACAIDHVDVEVLEHSRNAIRVRVDNPTPFPATIKVLSEHSSETGRPLEFPPLTNVSFLDIPPGKAVDRMFGEAMI